MNMDVIATQVAFPAMTGTRMQVVYSAIITARNKLKTLANTQYYNERDVYACYTKMISALAPISGITFLGGVFVPLATQIKKYANDTNARVAYMNTLRSQLSQPYSYKVQVITKGGTNLVVGRIIPIQTFLTACRNAKAAGKAEATGRLQ